MSGYDYTYDTSGTGEYNPYNIDTSGVNPENDPYGLGPDQGTGITYNTPNISSSTRTRTSTTPLGTGESYTPPGEQGPAPGRIDPSTPETTTTTPQQTQTDFDFEGRRQELLSNYQTYLDQINALGGDFANMRDNYSGALTDITNQNQAGIQSLMSQLQSPNYDAAQEYAATQQGYASAADMQAAMAGNRDMTIETAQGLTDDERSLMERDMRNAMQNIERQANDQLEAIFQATGSTTRYLAAADEVRQQISDERLSREMAIYQEDYARKLNAIQRADQQYQFAVQAGQTSSQEYLATRQRAVESAMSSYLQNVSMQLQATQGQFDMDSQLLVQQAEQIYKSAALEMGINEQVLNQLESEYNMTLAPELYAMQMALAQDQQDASFWNTIFGGIGSIASILTIFGL